MRTFRLLGVAAQAESLRLRRGAGAFARTAALLCAAAMFGLVTLGLLHAAAWIWLERHSDSLWATLYLALADLVLVLILVFASRSRRDPIAEEALLLRQQSLASIGRISPLSEALSLMRWRQAIGLGGHVVRAFRRR
ncbi:MAG: putative Holin-X, holin superfamily [Rubritepida sp.]|nr:putative Holin-X, holin superfamily [Rubritepida sp.]